MKDVRKVEIVLRDRSAGFESMLDLFTILSFVLIAASFLFTLQVGRDAPVVEIDARFAGRGTGEPVKLPENLIVLVVKREKGNDYLQYVQNGEKPTLFLIRKPINFKILDPLLPRFRAAKRIEINFLWLEERPDSAIREAIELWFESRELPDPRVVWAGKYSSLSE